MGGGNLARQNKKKGFAISGILYPLLILTLFLVVQMLFMLQTRKNVLDKARTELADSVNKSNQIYTNEELSTLLEQYKSDFDKYKIDSDKKIGDLKTDYETKIANLNSANHVYTEKPFFLVKRVATSNANPTKIEITNAAGPIYLEMKIYGQYAYINYGGYVDYKLGSFNTDTTLYGLGTNFEAKGNMANTINSITPSFASDTLTLTINFSNYLAINGSDVYFNIKLYRGYGIDSNNKVTIK